MSFSLCDSVLKAKSNAINMLLYSEKTVSSEVQYCSGTTPPVTSCLFLLHKFQYDSVLKHEYCIGSSTLDHVQWFPRWGGGRGVLDPATRLYMDQVKKNMHNSTPYIYINIWVICHTRLKMRLNNLC